MKNLNIIAILLWSSLALTFSLGTTVFSAPSATKPNLLNSPTPTSEKVSLADETTSAKIEKVPHLKDPMKVVATISPSNLAPGQTGEIKFHLELPPGYKAFEDQFIVEIKTPMKFPLSRLHLDPAKVTFDKFTKKDRRGFSGASQLTAVLEAPLEMPKNTEKLIINFTYQACTETYCLLPTDKILEVTLTSSESKLPVVSESFIDSIKNISNALRPDQQVTWLTFLLTFLAGVLTSLTPCVFPMIPITLGVLKNTMENRSKATLLGRALIYIAGMSLTYSALGVLAAATGTLFGSILGQTWFLVLICVFLLIMALSLFDVFEVAVPLKLQNLAQSMDTKSKRGVFLAGLLSGFLAAPCVAPVLVGILSLVATQKSYVTGFALLLSYAWGLGIILLLIALSTSFLRHLPRAGGWMEKLKYILGLLVLAAFYYYLRLLFPKDVWMFAIGAGLIALPFLMKFITFDKSETKKSPLLFVISLILIITGAAIIFESTRTLLGGNEVVIEENVQPNLDQFWREYKEEAFQTSLASGQPTVLDFYADWCAACHELKAKTFSESKVLAETSKFNLYRFDATKDSPVFDELKEKYKILGLPTVLFFNSKGQLVEELSLFEFEGPDKFLERISRIK